MEDNLGKWIRGVLTCGGLYAFYALRNGGNVSQKGSGLGSLQKEGDGL